MFFNNPSRIWFVHGFQSQENAFITEINLLNEIYPHIEHVSIKRWNSPAVDNLLNTKSHWDEALKQSKVMIQHLQGEIEKLPEDDQQNLILVGHSLGGAIVIKALARCAAKNIKIDHFVIAGAALDNNDNDLLLALKAVKNRSFSLVNMRDIALCAYLVFELHAALGTGYMGVETPEKYCEIVCKQGISHSIEDYLKKYLSCVQKKSFTSDEILVPQDMLNWRLPVLHGGFLQKVKQISSLLYHSTGIPVITDLYNITFWKIIAEALCWKLQQNKSTGLYRIISPDGLRMAWGEKSTMEIAFNKVKKQLGR